MKTCENRSCSTTILPSVSYCQKHRGRKHNKKGPKKTPSRFDAAGKPRPGGGLSHGRAARKAAWEKKEALKAKAFIWGFAAILGMVL